VKKTRVIYLVLLAILSVGVQAQQLITGTVKDNKNEPLIGASIVFKNTTTGTTADQDGNFSIQIDSGIKSDILMVSFIGYITQEVNVGEKRSFDIVLLEDTKLLGEVVVMGYAVQERGKLTGAVNIVGEDLISKLPVPSIDQALQGRAPGVVVTQNTGAPGEGVAVRIRGAGSLNSGNNPLYVVDGIPTLDINSISTLDIASITVLKDAGATAVYGSRAANGVVIVTTKSGGGSSPRIQFSTQVGVQSPSKLIEMTSTQDYVTIFNEAATNDNANKNPLLYRPLITEDIAATLPDVDYIDAILRDGVIQSHNISIGGSEGRTRYFLSGNYFDQQGIINSSSYSRISSRVNVETEVNKWLRAGVNLNLTKATTNFIGSSGDGAGGNGGSVIRYAFFRTPAIPIYDDNGEFTDKPERFDLFGDGYSPVGMLAYNNNERISNRLFGKFFVDITPFTNFKFTSNVGLDFTSANQRRFDRNWGSGNRINNPNQLLVSDGRYQTWTFSNFATYTKTFDRHNVNFLLGAEAIKVQGYDVYASEKGFPDQETNLVYLGNGLGQKSTDENETGNSLLSFFARINYDFQEKYIASATLRRDGSSRFGLDNRWGNFYAGSLGWRVDKTSLLIDSKSIDRLLLRIGYGSIGNQEIGDYPFTDMVGAGYNYPFGDVKSTGYAVSNLGNSKVKWETSNQLNIGVDLELWNGSFSMSLDYFNKVTSDLLVRQPIASSAGEAQSPWVNNGQVLNTGVELALNYMGRIGAVHYTISGNAATLHNEVLEVDAPIAGGAIGSDRITKTEKGYSIGSFYLYEMEGIFQSATDIFTHAFQGNDIMPGDVKFKDQNADGLIDGNDRTHTGSPIPKITAGLNLNVAYRNWDISIFVQGAYGQKIFSVLNRDIEGFYRPFNVTQRYYDNHWTGPGTSDEFPRASWDASGNNTKYSTRFLEDGSYTRLKNLQIGYNLPGKAMERFGFVAARIYVSGTNLMTFTKYQGLDPEMTVSNNAQGQGDVSAGLDWGTYPAARSYNVGFNLTF
jgi:TonB-linked SusC/RagA family outer membrane protein